MKSDPELRSQLVPMKFWDLLDQSILKQPEREAKDVGMYPSEASACITNDYGEPIVIGACLRAAWFRNKVQRKLYDKEHQSTIVPNITVAPYTPKELWKFKISQSAERDIHDEAKRANIYFANSHKFEWKLDVTDAQDVLIRGEVDLVVHQEPGADKPKIGIEVKSISGYYGLKQVFGTRSKSGEWLSMPDPKDHNLLQTCLYSAFFCLKEQQFDYFKLVYLSREDGEHNEFDVDIVAETLDGNVRHRVYVNHMPYTPTLYIEDIMDRYVDLHNHVVTDTLPPRDFELVYSKDKLQVLYDRNQLSKTDSERFSRGLKVTKGDWQCSYCKYQQNCYSDRQGTLVCYEEPASSLIASDVSIPDPFDGTTS